MGLDDYTWCPLHKANVHAQVVHCVPYNVHVISFQITSVDVDLLPENRTKEGQALIEAITEEDREKEEFRRRKTELLEKIRLQEDEFREMQDMVSSLEAKVAIGFFDNYVQSCFFPF